MNGNASASIESTKPLGPRRIAAFLAIACAFLLLGAAAGQSPTEGGTLRVGQVDDLRNLNPHMIGQYDGAFRWQVFTPLVSLHPDDLAPTPELAERWEFSEDGLTLTFHLRPNVQFHDGTELTSEIVAENIRRVQDADYGATQLRGTALTFTDLDTSDPRTLHVHFAEPNPTVLDFFSQFAIGTPDSLDDATRAVGTGPFRFVEWRPGDRITLERFENYWQTGLPYLDAIEIRILPDADALIANLQAGTIDMARVVPVTAAEALQADPRFEVRVSTSGSIYYGIGFVSDVEPLDDKRVRQALNRSMNRDRFVRVVLRGLGEPTCVPWPRSSPAYDEVQDSACEFDLEESRRLLAEAGYADGFTFTVETSRELTPDLVQFLQIWQQDLAQLNVQMRIQEISPAVWRERKSSATFENSWTELYANSNREPAVLFLQARPFLVNNPARFVDENYARLIEEARVEMDQSRRQEIFHELTEILIDEAFLNTLSYQPQLWAYSSSLRGFETTVDDKELQEAAWLDR